ncbi:TVP38/TMEM64 family protein [Clostridium manihotivorum]|uniref:TVP38/TMEM64 family membrane protein n=1 Tax=Clostridium manihotivorum TaxID=2320868 RepID=A0A3R5V7E7_9CLOT|nr:VTT domain-containing protein [Clostridium manihotivorum]QAA31797.1 TVP38/TMEM64 family protein [Clostridium manihotivorum]
MNKAEKMIIYKICAFLLCILIAIPIIKYLPDIIALTMSMEKFSSYIISLGSLGAIVFTSFQVLQTVIAPIPGEVIQVAGGYIYGATLGTIYSMIGLLLGGIIAFYFTRFIGANLIEKLLQREKLSWLSKIMHSNKFDLVIFIIFLVPGLPKDFLIYVAGLTPIKPLKFFIILTISRFPWTLASVSIGSNLHYGNYTATIVVALIACVAFILGIINKDKLINKFTPNNN